MGIEYQGLAVVTRKMFVKGIVTTQLAGKTV
jgi:hypothetical protein